MLNWKTYGALPRLRNYAEALAHFNHVVPIRGDADKTKPAGRRDQKWLSIYMREDKSVCIGNMWNKERPLLAYHIDGRVVIQTNLGASCRERIQRISGLNIQRKTNNDWVRAVTYVDGAEVVGEYPLNITWQNKREAVFILRGDTFSPIYLNPMPVYKYLMNKQAKAKLTKKYKPFMAYVEAMSKLSAYQPVDNPTLPNVNWDERRELGIPNANLNYRYNNAGEIQAQFLGMVDSDDPEEWYKAMVWMSANHWNMQVSDARIMFMHVVHRYHRDALFTAVKVEAGKFVHDRYATYFR